MTRQYHGAGLIVASQRCGFGDDQRGYCGERAVEHFAVTLTPGEDDGSHTMACQAHLDQVNHEIRDRHPVVGPRGLPGTIWRDSHPSGGPGWCELDGIDWLSAADAAPVTVDIALTCVQQSAHMGQLICS